jgi:hypothetical protein
VNQTRLISAVRFAIVLAMSISWFAMANRCALVLAVASTEERSHSCCQEDNDAAKTPGKGNEQSTGECCKTLDATFVSVAKPLTDSNASFALDSSFVALVVFPNTAGFMPLTIALNTGPPFASSFAEAVLQRSILAHAPPQLV